LLKVIGKQGATGRGIDRGFAGPSVWRTSTMALTEEDVVRVLRTCVDPEIPVNIVDLGLIYGVGLTPSAHRSDQWEVAVKMTLTSPGCPMSHTISHDVHRKLLELPEVAQARVEIVWEPQWTPERISPEGRRHLQLN
jgi:metal-sulfur cluster biosynthetic enzyme